MLGKPKFKYNDAVSFEVKDADGKKIKMYGRVSIIDEYGTFFDKSDVSYDIFVEEANCLFKHINEKFVKKTTKKVGRNLDTAYHKNVEIEDEERMN